MKGRRSMARIGILGGTFNPIHNGHLLLAEAAGDLLALDQVLLIPSGCSYMKDPDEILPGGLRLSMVRLAAADNPRFGVSDVEIVREGNSYTFETLEILRKRCPGAELFHIVGADTLFQMESWRYPERIFHSSVTVAAVREGFADGSLQKQAEHLNQKYGARIRLIPFPHMEISSTDIRERVRTGRSVRYLVPEPVRQFILQNNLYR